MTAATSASGDVVVPAVQARKRRTFRPARPIPYSIVIGPLLLFGLWSVTSATGLLDAHVLSAPFQVLEAAVELWRSGKLQSHLGTSASRAGIGLACGTLLGGTCALIAGLTQTGDALIDGPLQLKRAVPNVALIPLLIVWFGIGESMKIVTIALGTTIPIYVQTHAGLRAIDARYVELAQTLHLTRWQFIRYVALPGALPNFLLGWRLAFTSAWLSLVVVEQINATSGIGYMMSLARSYGQTEIIVLGLFIYGALGLSSDAIIRALERRALVWRRSLSN